MRLLIIGFLLGAASLTAAADKGLYERFASTLIYAPDFPTENAHELIAAGIRSEDPEIVELTLDAIGVKAFIESLSSNMVDMNMLMAPAVSPNRNLSNIPGLKNWLVDRYRDEFGKWDGDYSVIVSPGKPSGDGSPDFRALLAMKPGWVHIPYVLAAGWPGDGDVLDMLLSENIYGGIALVSLLNSGGFSGGEADQVRWDVLNSPEAADPRRVDLRLPAAQGLAMGRVVDAVPHLLDIGERHPQTQRTVVTALGGYDDADLRPYGERLKSLLEASRSSPWGAPTSAGFYKLEAIVESIDSQ